MKRAVLAAVTAVAFFGSAHAFAQTVGVRPPDTDTRINVTPEHRTVIKQHVAKENVSSIAVKEQITVGDTFPSKEVQLRDMPPDLGAAMSKYRYVYANDKVVLVEPESRRVMQIID